MKTKHRPQDDKAAAIRFGIELETKIPIISGVRVGGYHNGLPVTGALDLTGAQLAAPKFGSAPWRADRDGSIVCQPDELPCEFVSPILYGAEGVEHLCRFVEWLNAIGAKVDASCGVHITIGIESVIGSTNAEKVREFVRKLAHIAQWHARSLYGQTGTGRHLNRYSHTLAADVAKHMRAIIATSSVVDKERAAVACGRGMVNFQKIFRSNADGYAGAIEFRVFAGTVSLNKILHHLASVIGLCRRASEVQCLGAFKKNKLQTKRTASATSAVEFLWDYLGWNGASRPVALGVFGPLHQRLETLKAEAMRLCRKFDERYPDASL
jgi:hypothetical protein